MSAQFLMQQSPLLDSAYVKTASFIYTACQQMSKLINDLLDFTRTRLGQGVPISAQQTNLADVATQAVMQGRAFHPDRTISLSTEGDLSGQWDSSRIGQVFSNLIGNAIKYGDERKPINVALYAEGFDVIATVHNKGNAISEDDIPHIFEPLRRSSTSTKSDRDSSLGLGLYIAREIIRAHGGTIDVASSVEDGTTFTVRLPRKPIPT